jgi:hypothetical protein
MKKKHLIGIGIIVIIAIVLIVIFTGGEKTTRVERQEQKEARQDSKSSKSSESQAVAPRNFTSGIEERSGEGYTLAVTYPSTGVKSIDGAITKVINDQEVGATGDVVGTYKTYSSNLSDTVVMSFEGVDTFAFETVVIAKDDTVQSLSSVLQSDYQTKISSYLRQELKKRFPALDGEKANTLTQAGVIDAAPYRVADNGIVFMFAVAELKSDNSKGIHEVLVSFAVLENFLKDK